MTHGNSNLDGWSYHVPGGRRQEYRPQSQSAIGASCAGSCSSETRPLWFDHCSRRLWGLSRLSRLQRASLTPGRHGRRRLSPIGHS